MPDEDERVGVVLDRVLRELRRPVTADPAIDERVMLAISASPALALSGDPGEAGGAARAAGAWRWITKRRVVRVSPLGALAFAAGLGALAVMGARFASSRHGIAVPAIAAGSEWPAATPVRVAVAPGRTEWPVQFVLVAPGATSVAVAGDFNDWQPERLPLRRSDGGLWSAAVPLPGGRYTYSFLVDGRRWVADPTAPRAPGDDFGAPSSVVMVGVPTP